ncbi:MAG: carboxylating nicotinate-nucleotide diphosphorylase [Nitrososphaeraceae archaeon]|nr:carboxylating nicotinate-nucleotide diphosphorylase [Nitrososphaeraceae archaeon]MBV9668114.1 carboxylating nicotinate-nucleotide diphosphorylase [Nitrososphaeraceae archaeon]
MGNLQAYFNVRESLINFLIEDIGTGDITSNTTLSPSTFARAQIVCKTEDTAMVCGLKEAGMIFDICDCRNRTLVKDGTIVEKQTIVMDITGKALSILKAERTALNLIMRMSGIATETRKFVDAVNHYKGSIRIACTRKTVPGLRFFDKKAVSIGGGDTHRMALDDMVLIKDNHIFFSESVEKSVKLARQNVGSSVRVECEVTTLDSAIAAINAGADIIMLDNFSPSDVSRTIKEITKKGIRKRAKLEISGGISLQNVKSYAKSRPDIISIGRLTHSPEAINFSLEMIEKIRS